MNLISCDNCGIVLDGNKLAFPQVIEDENGIIEEKVIWTEGGYVSKIDCPVCETPIAEEK